MTIDHFKLSMLSFTTADPCCSTLSASKSHVKEKCNTSFQDCSLQKPITVKCSLSYLWIPLPASWQVKWEGYKGRTSEGNILINYSICNNSTGRSGNSRWNNSFRHYVNLGLTSPRINKEKNGTQQNVNHPLKFQMLCCSFCYNWISLKKGATKET